MNWLAKISWNNLRKYLGAFNGLIVLVVVLPGIFYAGYRFGNYYHGYQQVSLDQQKARLDELYQAQEKYIQQINTLSLELELEKMANKRIQTTLSELERSNFDIKKELSFYQRIMAPEKEMEGLVIEELEVENTGSTNHYRFRLTLVQQNKQKSFVKGRFDFEIEGNLAQQPHTVLLSKLEKGDALQQFGFKYFQVAEGEFILPEGFVPEKVNIIVNLPKTKWQKANTFVQTLDWPGT